MPFQFVKPVALHFDDLPWVKNEIDLLAKTHAPPRESLRSLRRRLWNALLVHPKLGFPEGALEVFNDLIERPAPQADLQAQLNRAATSYLTRFRDPHATARIGELAGFLEEVRNYVNAAYKPDSQFSLNRKADLSNLAEIPVAGASLLRSQILSAVFGLR